MIRFGSEIKKVDTDFSYCKLCQKHHCAEMYVTHKLPKSKNTPDKYHSLCKICKNIHYFSTEETQRYFIDKSIRKIDTNYSHCNFCKKNLYAQIYVTYVSPKNKDKPDKYHSICLICNKVYYFSDDEAKKHFNRYTVVESIIIILQFKIENLVDKVLKGFRK